ncbi:MAG: hypothetical protein ACO3JL_03250 [Myxococcota bacterium]
MRSFAIALLSSLLFTAPALTKDKSVYEDTKHRFSMRLPLGWRLHPMPGDTSGMMFRRDVDGAFALLHVGVRQQRPLESVTDSLEEATASLRAEIGFEQGKDRTTSVGLHPAMRRSVSVFASGDARTVRAIELYVLHAFGYVHTLHFEHVQDERTRFARDQDRLIGAYEPLAGRTLAGPLIGQWESTSGGAPLVMTEEGRFELGQLRDRLSGTWDTDGGRLTLHLPQGQERYQYQLDGTRLTLSSTNLPSPMVYERTSSGRFLKSKNANGEAPRLQLSRATLQGKWRVLDAATTDPLMLHLAPSGAVSFGPLSGRWEFARGLLTITSTAGETMTYHASMDGPHLLLGGGDLDRELRLLRQQ